MPQLVKGSHEAMAWHKKMKKARIRAAGRRTEMQFFGPGGECEDEAAAKLRTNPKRISSPAQEPYFTSWQMLIDYLKREGWKPLGKKGVAAFGRTIQGLSQVLQLEARVWRVLYSTVVTFSTRSLGAYHTLDRALIAANRQANDYLSSKTPKKNPKKVSPFKPHPDFQITSFPIQGGGESYGILWYLDGVHTAGFSTAQEAYNSAMRHIQRHPEKFGKQNPITLNGNPPKRIRSDVAGIMYNRVWEIQAEKTGDKHKGFWYHPFKKGSDVQMLALDTGDILIHSKAGKKLWRPD